MENYSTILYSVILLPVLIDADSDEWQETGTFLVALPSNVRDMAQTNKIDDRTLAIAFDPGELGGSAVAYYHPDTQTFELDDEVDLGRLTGITYLPDGNIAVADWISGAAIYDEEKRVLTELPALDVTVIGSTIYIATTEGLVVTLG